ncbi:ferritin-like domain-containing protein [Oscillospiraceae bacterium PP1C4]
MTILQKLQVYINAELGDAALYRELAKIAPDENAHVLLLEFAEDEQSHADEFKRIYRAITGHSYNPAVPPVVLKDSYRDILQDRVLDESEDFRKYGKQYLQTTQNIPLRNAYYRARTDENVHALRLLYLLSE